ncbi:hypothetical protein J2W17_000482 [Pseudomonas lini]|uniref:hypothetical protein n=1 Tax=Pseudomonas lini TaxID=163011 RepID=UPI002783DC24|nr:hypothetical protein [Pseudomonas lini]MDQ0121545.1 hypothetical protein [Pseudomonas lini]
MNTLFETASEAMSAAYELAKTTGKRVWRHAVESKYGVTRYIISFNKDPQNALGSLAA